MPGAARRLLVASSVLALGLLPGCATAGLRPDRTVLMGGGSGAPVRSTAAVLPAAVAWGCDRTYPWRTNMATRGVAEPGLYLCSTPDGAWTRVHNVSKSKVWYLTSPAHVTMGSVWDSTRSRLKVELFRRAVTRAYAAQGQPLQTVEPGTTIYLRTPPSRVQLYQSAFQQMAWMTTKVSVNTVRSKALGATPAVLGRGSPTRKAVVTCVVSGYNAATRLSSSEDASARLRTALGLRGDITKCSKALAKAESRAPKRSYVLTVDDLADRTRTSGWQGRVNRLVNQAIRHLRYVRLP